MKIEFLGTGGAIPTPRPLCFCHICKEAREKGVPYSRGGPSVYVHGPNVLIDTPEDIYTEINRSTITSIDGVLFSHWHPDHVMGRRVLESISADWKRYPPQPNTLDVFIPEQVWCDFQERLGTFDHLSFFKEQHFISTHEIKDGDTVTINDVAITPFRLAEDYVYAFLFQSQGKNVLIAMDELNGWEPPAWLPALDVAVLPKGLDPIHLSTGERMIPDHHPVLQEECTFEQTLEIVRNLQAKQTILTHIEEEDKLSYDDLVVIEEQLKEKGIELSFAYDTRLVTI